jgi:hypothetical protein
MNRRVTRATTSKSLGNLQGSSAEARTTTSNIPSSAEQDSMNRKLIFDSTESDRKRDAAMLAPDAPSFDLDTPPDDDNAQAKGKGKEVSGQMVVLGQQGCSKETDVPSGDSITPVLHEYQKRVLKVGKFDKSPYVNYENHKNYSVSKSVECLYDMVCQHGWKSSSETNTEVVVDVGNYYVSLGNLADSVAPGKKLINIVAELAIYIIAQENQNPRKYIMPLRVAVSSLFIFPFLLLFVTFSLEYLFHQQHLNQDVLFFYRNT